MTKLDKISIVILAVLFQLAMILPMIYKYKNYEDNQIKCIKWQCKEKFRR